MYTIDSEPKKSDYNLDLKLDNNTTIKPKLFYNTKDILVLDDVITQNEALMFRNIIDNPNEHMYYKGNRDRVSINTQQLSEAILDRCNEWFPRSIRRDSPLIDTCVHNDNRLYWNCIGINNSWRLVKCNPGSNLRRHYDGTYVKSINCRSFFTVMLYLNDTDGDTKFIDGISITPKIGRLLIFDQTLEHEGLINNDLKYFIRSEIMFERSTKIDTENDRIAMKKYLEAIEINKTNPDLALQLETEAFKLSPILESMVYNF
jgi:hypothetical protein